MTVKRSTLFRALLGLLFLLAGPVPLGCCAVVVHDTLVLGAGMAGIRAAGTLARGGHADFLLLEASPNRIGGRVKATAFANRTVELGANWIEGPRESDSPIWEIARHELRPPLRGNWSGNLGTGHPRIFVGGKKLSLNASEVVYKKFVYALNCTARAACFMSQAKNVPDVPLRQTLTGCGWPAPPEQRPEETAAEFFVVDWEDVFDPEGIGTMAFFEDPCAPGGDLAPPSWFVTDQRGYVAVIEHLANRYLKRNDSRLVLGAMVAKIEYGPEAGMGAVVVTTTDGRMFYGKRCIVTFSAGVVNHAIAGYDNTSLVFHPALPKWKSDAFQKAEMGTYLKIFLHFDRVFWDNDADFVLHADPDGRRGYYSVWEPLNSHGGEHFFPLPPRAPALLMVTLLNEEAIRVEAMSETAVVEEIMNVLRNVFGGDGRVLPDRPLAVTYHRWYGDPLFRGSYSSAAVGTTRDDFTNMQRPVDEVLYFAGEHTDPDWYGYLLGAFRSGERAAQLILNGTSSSIRV